MARRRQSRYDVAVQWIADNDESAERKAENMIDLVSVLLVADVFNTTAADVVDDVMALRHWDVVVYPPIREISH